jgi:hypothetical protein
MKSLKGHNKRVFNNDMVMKKKKMDTNRWHQYSSWPPPERITKEPNMITLHSLQYMYYIIHYTSQNNYPNSPRYHPITTYINGLKNLCTRLASQDPNNAQFIHDELSDFSNDYHEWINDKDKKNLQECIALLTSKDDMDEIDELVEESKELQKGKKHKEIDRSINSPIASFDMEYYNDQIYQPDPLPTPPNTVLPLYSTYFVLFALSSFMAIRG